MLVVAPLLFALAQASIAPGQAGAPVPPSTALTAPAVSARGGDEVVCKRESVTGTRLPAPKICRTRGEWADMAVQAREATQQIQSQRSGSPR